jgi:hypothetical protein
MDTRRECNDTRDEEERLLMGKDPSCPPPPDSRGNPGAVLYEIENVVLKSMPMSNRQILPWKLAKGPAEHSLTQLSASINRAKHSIAFQ